MDSLHGILHRVSTAIRNQSKFINNENSTAVDEGFVYFKYTRSSLYTRNGNTIHDYFSSKIIVSWLCRLSFDIAGY